MFTQLDLETIDLIEKEYVYSQLPWSLGFSGGKDSTALLKLVYNALLNIKNPAKIINVVYCDTGVEIPIVNKFVKDTFEQLKLEIAEFNLPIKLIIAEPKIEHRFFIKVIGKGYPTPTNKFRWCTDKLRVLPLQEHLENKGQNVVLIGVRKGESLERDRIINLNNTNNPFFLKQADHSNIKLFAPIINYHVSDVWSIVKSNQKPLSIDGIELELIYQKAGQDQINFIDTSSNALQKGRFGCWTCTVVRKDKAINNLIENGFLELKPLLDFRNWIYSQRDNPDFRCKIRRNGNIGLGPFTLEARKEILTKLLVAQSDSGFDIISEVEIEFIKKLWNVDKNDKNYKEK